MALPTRAGPWRHLCHAAVARTTGVVAPIALIALIALAALAALGGAAGAEGAGEGAQEKSARSALLILDANSGRVLQQSAADAPRHPASLAKLMTLYLVFERIAQGRLAYDSKIRVSPNAAAAAPSKLDLDAGAEIALIDAVKVLITKSANDVAVAIAEHIAGSEARFAALMTQKARQLGMAATTFKNASGLPDEEQVTTARDTITLTLHLQDDFPEHYPLFATRFYTYNGEIFRNHNTLLFHFPGTDGLKTGYTRASGFNLVASVHRGRKHVIGAVFGGASAASRNYAIENHLARALAQASSEKTRKIAPLRVARREQRLRGALSVPAPQRALRPARPPPPPAPLTAGARPDADAPRGAGAPSADAPSSAHPEIATPRVRQVLLADKIQPLRPVAVSSETPTSIEALLGTAQPRGEDAGAADRARASAPDPGAPFPAARPQAPIIPSPPAATSTPPQVAPVAAGHAANPQQPPIANASSGAFQIQIGAYQSAAEAERQLAFVKTRAPLVLINRAPTLQQIKQGERAMFRARYGGFEAEQKAAEACQALKRLKIDCLVIRGQ